MDADQEKEKQVDPNAPKYYVPNRHDRRKAASIKRKEERRKKKHGK